MWTPVWEVDQLHGGQQVVAMVLLVVLCAVLLSGGAYGGIPYANDFPYVSYGYEGGASGSADASGFVQNQLSDKGNNLKAAQDVSKFYNLENVSNGHNLAHEKQGASTDTLKHTTGEDFETDKKHNRKHVKSGFHNTYHKDESGSNSSYYEDSDDRGGKLVYDKRHGTKGDAHDSQYRENLRDGSLRDKYDDRYGGYDNRGTHDRHHLVAEDQGNRLGHRDKYVRGQAERYEMVDDGYGHRPYAIGIRENYGMLHRPLDDRRPLYDDYGSGGHHQQSLYAAPLRGHHLGTVAGVSSLTRPREDGYFARHRITIYEDPRDMLESNRGSLLDSRRPDFVSGAGGEGGAPFNGPRLDFQPSPLRFRDERRSDLRFRDF
uniref:Putative conserved secreted protein n=1 Tax=Lutzomyia longipalpis TaxID=7200 RepID=A0A1B0CUW0_LUTLO